jgi:cobalt-zinc-cadmium efflux system outer membrane protein
MKVATIILLILIPALGAAQSQRPAGRVSQGSVSQKIEERTGHKLNPAAQAGGLTLPDGVSLADGLAEDEAVAIALWNNAAFQADLAALGLARADVVEAGLLRNPVFSLLFPLGPKQLEATVTWPLEAFWQRPRRVAAAQLELERVTESLVQNGLNLARDVRIAFADLALASERARIASEQVRERGQIVEIVAARFRAGDIGELETSASRLDARLAEEQAARFTHEAALTGVRLRSLLGMESGEPAFVTAFSTAEPNVTVSLQELVKTALAARPELRAAELAMEAAGQRAKWERSKVLALAGIIDANGEGKKGFEAGPGLQVEFPIFHRNKGGITRAEAELERAARQYAAVRQRIVMEVQEAYAQFTQSREALLLWRARMLPPIEEDIGRAQKAYEAGDVAWLYVLETTRRLTEARLHEVDVKAGLQRAAAQLDRSVGRRLIANR